MRCIELDHNPQGHGGGISKSAWGFLKVFLNEETSREPSSLGQSNKMLDGGKTISY